MRSCGVLLLVAAATTAYAQPAPDLTREFQAGVDAFRLGHYDDARTHLEKARAIDPKLPGPHRFLAAVAQAQGRWQDCLDETRTALAANPHSSEAPETRKLHDECRVSAGRAPYRGPELVDSAAVAVTTNVPGATVKIGGLTYGGTPLAPRPITAGTLDVEIDKPGWKPAHVSVEAPAGIVTDVAVDLEPDPSQQNPEMTTKPITAATRGVVVLPPGAAISIDGKPVSGDRVEIDPGTHEVEARIPDHDPWRRRVRVSAAQRIVLKPDFVETAAREQSVHVGYGYLGGGAVLLGAGFVTALISDHASADAREMIRVESARDPSNPGYDVEPKHTRADITAAHDRATTFATVSDITYAVGLVGIGVGAYYLYKGARERSDAPPPFAIAPTHGGAFIAKELRW